MSQSDFGNLSSPLTGADFIDNKLEPWRDALHSSHSGSSRPSYAAAGMLWLDTTTTPWVIKLFDGSDDIPLFNVNSSTNVATPYGFSATDDVTFDLVNAEEFRALANLGSGPNYMRIVNADSSLSASRYLQFVLNNASREIDLGGDLTLAGALTTSGAYALTLTLTGATSVTLPTSGTLATTVNAAHGQCRLSKSSTNLLLSRFNGKNLIINGVQETIPSAGVTLAATLLAANTTYYIYAYMNSGTMTLEPSTTGHATDSTTGVEIKSGDATRTLVGMARTDAGMAWIDTDANRLVASWFNRKPVRGAATFTANRSTTNTGAASEINSEIRNNFLCWGDTVQASCSGNKNNNTSGSATVTIINLDGTTGLSSQTMQAPANSYQTNAGSTVYHTPSEGFHYHTIFGRVDGNTGAWQSGFALTTLVYI